MATTTSISRRTLGQTVFPDTPVVSRRCVLTARVCSYAGSFSSPDFAVEGARERRAVGERWILVSGEERTGVECGDLAARIFGPSNSRPGGFREACALHSSQPSEGATF